MKANRPVRRIYLLPAIFGPLFVLFWAVSGSVVDGARVTGILLAAVLVLIPFVLACLLVPIAVHELGHLWAGRRAGYSFVSLRIGPFTWGGRGRRTDWNVGLPMGLCEMHPRYGLPTWREAVFFVSGGPLASLTATLAGLIVFFLSDGRLDRSPLFSEGAVGFVQFAGLLWAYVNGGTLIGSLLPFRMGGLQSDGLQLLDLWRRRAGCHG